MKTWFAAPTKTPNRSKSNRWRKHVAAGLLAGLCLIGLDLYVGNEQQRILVAREELRARLDRLAFYGVRTGIDDISYDPPSAYEIKFRVQNATDEPLYVMLPIVTAFVQVGPGWTAVPVGTAHPDEGSVVRLIDDCQVEQIVTIDAPDYTELLPGYIHLKLNLEAYVSPEENPQEDIGERHEDIFIYLKDFRRANDAKQGGAARNREMRPNFIPLRAWTLIPRPVTTNKRCR